MEYAMIGFIFIFIRLTAVKAYRVGVCTIMSISSVNTWYLTGCMQLPTLQLHFIHPAFIT